MSGLSLFASLGAALHSPLFSFKILSPIAKSNPALSAFEIDLSTQLHHLKLISFDGSACLSMPWLCHAMKVVLSTHASAEAFVPELQQALLHGDTKWLHAYLDDSVKLLDTCNALREAIKEIKSYHGHVKLALNALDKAYIGEAQLRRAKAALCQCVNALKKKDEGSNNVGGHRRSRLENCSSMLRRMGEKLNMENASKGTFFKVSHAAQVTTIFICGVLTATLSLKPCRPLSTIVIDGQSTWGCSLTSLQQRLKEQMERQKAKGENALLQELCKTDFAVRSLKDRVERLLERKRFPLKDARISDLKKYAVSLKDCSIELNNGLDLLHQHVEDVFKILITSRMALLEIYSCHHVTSSLKLPHKLKDQDC